MLPVECLFHTEGISLVEAIMNNYEFPEDEANQGFIVHNENEHYYGGIDRKKKKKEDNNSFINNQESDGDYNILYSNFSICMKLAFKLKHFIFLNYS